MSPLLGKILQVFTKFIPVFSNKKEQISNAVIKDVASISKFGWRQGCVLPIKMAKRMCENLSQYSLVNLNDSDLIFLVSHDCDITNSSFEKEPNVELMLARNIAIEHQDNSLFWGRNIRKFQFIHTSGQLYEISVHDRILVDRTLLSTSPPDNERVLSKDVIKQICLWLTKRYTRSAFPDSFNLRITKKNWKDTK